MAMISVFLVIIGLLCVVGGWTDGAWLMESSKGREWTRMFGRKRARVFYVLGGTLLAGMGVAAWFWGAF